MGEFFHGWRRKSGLLTLLIACVFMIGWIRTYFITDLVSAPFGTKTYINVDSFRSNLIFRVYPRASNFSWFSLPSHVNMMFGWDDPTRAALKFIGFGGGAFDENPDDPTRECEMWSCPAKLFGCDVYWRSKSSDDRERLGVVIPYVSIVIPLTLLSAFLLLFKPRPAKKLETLSLIVI